MVIFVNGITCENNKQNDGFRGYNGVGAPLFVKVL
jgi:hypothetical protein